MPPGGRIELKGKTAAFPERIVAGGAASKLAG